MRFSELEQLKMLGNYGLYLTYKDGEPFFADENAASKSLRIQYGSDSSATTPWAIYEFQIGSSGIEFRAELNLLCGRESEFDDKDAAIQEKLKTLLQPLNEALRGQQDLDLTGFREDFASEFIDGIVLTKWSTYFLIG